MRLTTGGVTSHFWKGLIPSDRCVLRRRRAYDGGPDQGRQGDDGEDAGESGGALGAAVKLGESIVDNKEVGL